MFVDAQRSIFLNVFWTPKVLPSVIGFVLSAFQSTLEIDRKGHSEKDQHQKSSAPPHSTMREIVVTCICSASVLHFICSWTTVVLTLRHMTPRQCRGTLIGPANLTRHSLQMSAHMADSANPEILNLWLQFGHGCLAESAAHRARARHWVTCGKEPVCQ